MPELLQGELTYHRMLLQGFQGVANHGFLLEQLLADLLELPAFDQHRFLRLPDFYGLLLTVAQQPLSVFAVAFAFA